VFWKKARRTYAGVTCDDPDIQAFHALSANFQTDVYKGVGGRIHDIGHRWIASRTQPGKALEIGFGSGRHALFFSGNKQDYFVSEYSNVHFGSKYWQDVRGRGVQCDARKLPFCDAAFQTVISIYNLEHIQDLQRVFSEVHRVLAASGAFLVALPCEGGLAWNLGRELTTRRRFQKKYRVNYDKIIAYEHVWDFKGVLNELIKCGMFEITCKRYFPSLFPSVDLNLIGCIECRKI
jgi:SAM-dependent methyltransferase